MMDFVDLLYAITMQRCKKMRAKPLLFSVRPI